MNNEVAIEIIKKETGVCISFLTDFLEEIEMWSNGETEEKDLVCVDFEQVRKDIDTLQAIYKATVSLKADKE